MYGTVFECHVLNSYLLTVCCIAVHRLWSTYHGHRTSSCHWSIDESLQQHAAWRWHIWCTTLLLFLFFCVFFYIEVLAFSHMTQCNAVLQH